MLRRDMNPLAACRWLLATLVILGMHLCCCSVDSWLVCCDSPAYAESAGVEGARHLPACCHTKPGATERASHSEDSEGHHSDHSCQCIGHAKSLAVPDRAVTLDLCDGPAFFPGILIPGIGPGHEPGPFAYRTDQLGDRRPESSLLRQRCALII